MKQYCVYIMASKKNGTLYTGVTSNLPRRSWEHRSGAIEGFTKKYGVHKLVYYELFGSAEAAIMREKKIKRFNRAWKVRLINKENADWNDLYEKLF